MQMSNVDDGTVAAVAGGIAGSAVGMLAGLSMMSFGFDILALATVVGALIGAGSYHILAFLARH